MTEPSEPVFTTDMVMWFVSVSPTSLIGGPGWIARVAHDDGGRPEALQAAVDACVDRGWLVAAGPDLWRATDAGKIEIAAIVSRAKARGA